MDNDKIIQLKMAAMLAVILHTQGIILANQKGTNSQEESDALLEKVKALEDTYIKNGIITPRNKD